MFENIKKIEKLGLLVLLLTLVWTKPSMGAVIFEDNFDQSPNWQSQQTVNKSHGGEDINFGRTFSESCTTYCPPAGWTSYRTASSQWTDDRRRDTFVLDAEGARGGHGKGITYNVESTDDYGTWAGGSLDLWLGDVGHQELYIRMWIKYSDEWYWSSPSRDMHGQQKLIRISTFNDDISDTTYNPHVFGASSGNNWPVWYPDWYYNKSYDYAFFFSSVRKAPDYDASGDDTSHTNVSYPASAGNDAQGDNQWHCYEFRVKMNSTLGAADGEWEFFLDGVSKKSRNNIVWKKAGSNSRGWNWLMFLDNVTVSPYAKSMNKEMAIYMDDVVVATSYIGPDYLIPGGVPVVEDPVEEDPVVEDPVEEDPVVEDPVVEDPVVEDPVVEPVLPPTELQTL